MNKPVFWMMVGLPGSGKSTIAKIIQRSVPNTAIHSSDELRGELFGNVNDQSKNDQLFIELHRRIKADLAAGRNVIYDATNLNKKRRASFLTELKHINCFKQCVLVLAPLDTCHIRNDNRFERQVLGPVINRMYMNFQPPFYSEGFDAISIEHNYKIEDTFRKYDLEKMFKPNSWFMNFDQENKHHRLTLGAHCDAAASYISAIITERARNGADDEELNRLATLADAAWIHDIGKLNTKTRVNAKGEDDGQCHYYQHHCAGAYDCFFYLRNCEKSCELDSPENKARNLYISNLIYWHMMPYTAWKQSEKAKERDKRLMTEQMYEDVLLLHEADLAAH